MHKKIPARVLAVLSTLAALLSTGAASKLV